MPWWGSAFLVFGGRREGGEKRNKNDSYNNIKTILMEDVLVRGARCYGVVIGVQEALAW
jgi:hypothetical protein